MGSVTAKVRSATTKRKSRCMSDTRRPCKTVYVQKSRTDAAIYLTQRLKPSWDGDGCMAG